MSLQTMIWGAEGSPSITPVAGPTDFQLASQMGEAWLNEPFPISGAVEPAQPGLLSRITDPWVNMGTSLYGRFSEDLPALLFETGMEKLGLRERVVQENADTTRTYVGPAYSGGAPADPRYVVLPGGGQGGPGVVRVPVGGGGGSGSKMTIAIVIAVGLVGFLMLRK